MAAIYAGQKQSVSLLSYTHRVQMVSSSIRNPFFALLVIVAAFFASGPVSVHSHSKQEKGTLKESKWKYSQIDENKRKLIKLGVLRALRQKRFGILDQDFWDPDVWDSDFWDHFEVWTFKISSFEIRIF